jgi:RNA polymerase sigma-70 factor (ECF subfamily)
MIEFNAYKVIAGCRKNNRTDQNLLFEKYKRKVFGICLRYAASSDQAKDLQQESFIKIFNILKNNDLEIQSLESWIHRITVNTSIDYYRKQKRFGEIALNVESESEVVLPDIINKLHEEDLIKLIQGIPEPYRSVFNLYIIDGLSHKEISQMLTITESSSRSYLTRAKEFLKSNVMPRFYSNVKRYG